MAYRSILGGSPLGLIGVRSGPTTTGYSSFNIDKSRNIKVAEYNKSRAGTLFTGKRRLRAWPDIKAMPPSGEGADATLDITGTATEKGKEEATYAQSTLHNDSIYDTSILNIIEKLANTKGQLKPSDFAYLKNVGVYPNNRLMIARRFASPSADNIMIKKKPTEVGSLATLISWVPESEDFLNMSFGEEWVEAEADFKGVLNSLGEDLGIGNLGGIGGAAGNVMPLPGFTEIFQRAFLAKIGLLEESAANMIPAGNPNLIKQAKMRKTVGYSEAGSGLSCTVNIKFLCEYELKYISGIDPTIVWMDLISTITRFATSESDVYGLSKAVSAKLIRWANNPSTLLKDVFQGIKDSINVIVTKVTKFINDIFNSTTSTAAADKAAEEEEESGEEDIYAAAKEERSVSQRLLNTITGLLGKVSEGLIMKYRVKIIGIVNALSGLPSTPWHLTIGNPLRPMFCSGDMLCKSVTLKLGPQLAFNDLPSSITAEFNLENARPWGMQEIMAKFNSGYLRAVDVQKTYYETGGAAVGTGKDAKIVAEPIGILPGETYFKPEDYATATQSGTASGGSASTPQGGSTGDVNNTSNANSLPPGTTQSNADGGVSQQTGTQSENTTFAQGNQQDKKDVYPSDPHEAIVTNPVTSTQSTTP